MMNENADNEIFDFVVRIFGNKYFGKKTKKLSKKACQIFLFSVKYKML
jgi:hypothetical protein